MRANINLIPRKDVHYDIWCPMALSIKPSPDPTINAVEKECLENFQSVDKSEHIEIYNNGEPPAWGERVAGILKKYDYKHVTVHPGQDYAHFNNPSKLFPDQRKPYRMQPIGGLKEQIQKIFDFYKTRTWSIEEPKSGVCGHYYRGRMLWTQVQKSYDPSKSANESLMTEMKKLLEPTTKMVKNFLKENNVKMKNLEKKITLRLLDYVNKDNLNSKLATHLDASLLTGLLYHDAPTLYTVDFTDDSLTIANSVQRDISELVSAGNCFWVPGYVYADEMKSYVSPNWHGVQVPDQITRRLSMVVRVECELVQNGTKVKIPGYEWNDQNKTWSKQ